MYIYFLCKFTYACIYVYVYAHMYEYVHINIYIYIYLLFNCKSQRTGSWRPAGAWRFVEKAFGVPFGLS